MKKNDNVIVEVRNLTKRVISPEGELVLLDNIQFTITQGEAVAIVGASGSGKSTLLGLLAGLDTSSEGSILLDGKDIGQLNEDERAALRGEWIGFVFQTFHLLPNLSALENVMLPLELAGNSESLERAKDVLVRVGLEERIHHYPKQLSGGEQQRVAIARAFAPGPRLLLADEPTGSLDRNTGERVIDLLFEINQERNATLVLVTHDDNLARRCQRQLLLDAGQLQG